MSEPKSDAGVLHHINQLVEEEHALLNAKERGADDHARLEAMRVELDQCWDLLRQRKARQEFDQNPDDAAVRPAKVVENYKG